MMDIEAALFDSSKKTIEMVAQAVGNDKTVFKRLIELAFSGKHQISSRAARVVSLCCEKSQSLVKPYVNQIAEKLVMTSESSVKKDLAKLSSLYPPDDEDVYGLLIDSCFKWLPSFKESIATKYYAMEILVQAVKQYPELRNELVLSIEELIPLWDSGLKSKGKQILDAFKKNKL